MGRDVEAPREVPSGYVPRDLSGAGAVRSDEGRSGEGRAAKDRRGGSQAGARGCRDEVMTKEGIGRCVYCRCISFLHGLA
jgi:hypothetical protein